MCKSDIDLVHRPFRIRKTWARAARNTESAKGTSCTKHLERFALSVLRAARAQVFLIRKDLVLGRYPIHIDQSALNLVTIYMAIVSQLNALTGPIRPEERKLFALKLKKKKKTEFSLFML